MGIWEIAPSEFWAMTPQEWWWVYDAKVGEPRYGNMPESVVEELYEMLD